jgi:threonine/homoserine/homoserine lactone efflux protein
MVDIILLFFTAFVIGLSGAMMPGPVLAVNIAQTPRSGMKTGPILVGGHAIAEGVVVVLLSLGLAAIVEYKIISNTIGLIGGVALLIMATGMIIEIFKSKTNFSSSIDQPRKTRRLVLDGIVTSLSNPYWFVWWATTGSAFLIKSLKFGYIGPATFYFGHILSDLAWYSLVSFLVWKGRKLISGLGYNILIGICALFLVYLGVVFIYDGISGAI